MGGMTDALLRLTLLAEQDDGGCNDELQAIGERYTETAKQLIDGEQLVSRAVEDGRLAEWKQFHQRKRKSSPSFRGRPSASRHSIRDLS